MFGAASLNTWILKTLFGGWIKHGCLRIQDSSGDIHIFGDEHSPRSVRIEVINPALPRRLLGDFMMALGEGYMNEDYRVVNGGSIYEFLELLASNLANAPMNLIEKGKRFFLPLTRLIQQYNPIAKSKENVGHHYDLSAELYKCFLDKDMQYSCAYFLNPEMSLENAQLAKKQHIAAKLMLRPGMRVLDIGCGWGGMAIYLAKHYGVSVVGLTLSEEQIKIARARVDAEGISDMVTFFLRDYREESGTYDRIVSVGMFEHVGVNYYDKFFSIVSSLLKPDGVMLLHSIGRMEKSGNTNSWVRRYIFPGGYAPALSEVFDKLEKTGLWAADMEIWRLHYAETLRHWWYRFDQKRDKMVALYDERFCRMWEFYLRGSEISFRYMNMMVFQIQMSKSVAVLPITRNYMMDGYLEKKSGTFNTVLNLETYDIQKTSKLPAFIVEKVAV